MSAFFESAAFNIFMFVSGVTSIVSLFIGIWKYRKTFVVLNAILVIALSVLTSYSYFNYLTMRSAEATAARERQIAKAEAKAILGSLPPYLFLEPGKARGVAFAGLAYLEQHRALYPETFKLAQNTTRVDIEMAQKAVSSVDESRRLQVAGETMLAILQGLAGDTR